MGLLDKAFDMLGDHYLPSMNAHTRMLQAALALIANNGQNGGLQGLVERFREAGLAHVIHSWIGSGHNLPVTRQQMEQILGHGHVQQIAEETGYPAHEAADRLTDMLPDLIDKLTPDGKIPRGGLGNMSTLLDYFMGRYH